MPPAHQDWCRSSEAEDDEALPLLDHLEKARREAPASAESRLVFQSSRYMNANEPHFMLLSTLGQCAMNVVAVAGAYFFVLAQPEFTPRCYKYTERNFKETLLYGLCSTSGLCFWTFPTVCVLMVFLVYMKNFFDKRLFYECLLNSCLLDYEDQNPLNYYIFIFLIAYLAMAAGMLGFIVGSPGDKDEVMNVGYSTLAYFSPILSFLIIFVNHWNIKANLIPLAKFCTVDPTMAAKLLEKAVFVPETYLQEAYEELEESLDKQDFEGAVPSNEYFGMLLAVARWKLPDSKLDMPEWAWYETVLAKLGMPPVDDYSSSYPPVKKRSARRNELVAYSQYFKKGYWAARLLTSKHLKDPRADDFRKLAKVQRALTFAAVLLCVFLYTSSLVTFLNYQRVLPNDSLFVRLLGSLEQKIVASPPAVKLTGDAVVHSAKAAGQAVLQHLHSENAA